MSKLFRLSLPDWIKGFLMVVLGAVLTTLEQTLSTGGFSTVNWSTVTLVGVNAGIAYLIKNYFTTSQGAAFGLKSTVEKNG